MRFRTGSRQDHPVILTTISDSGCVHGHRSHRLLQSSRRCASGNGRSWSHAMTTEGESRRSCRSGSTGAGRPKDSRDPRSSTERAGNPSSVITQKQITNVATPRLLGHSETAPFILKIQETLEILVVQRQVAFQRKIPQDCCDKTRCAETVQFLQKMQISVEILQEQFLTDALRLRSSEDTSM